MSDKIQRVKGMYDILPTDTPLWRRVERTAEELLEAYGYREIRLPLLEKTVLFAGAIGEATDVVAKEMYSFDDRNGTNLSLRPEGTAGCVRAVIQNGMLKGHALKLWYAGPMFRHENVQRGRNRQFYQIGAEAIGLPGPDVDAELILLLARLWRRLGLDGIRLELNTLGSPASRGRYREALVAYLRSHAGALDADSTRRLEINPLRVLDSKNPDMAGVIAGAPSLLDHLDDDSAAYFEKLRALLDAAGVGYAINPRLVRGLDYYTHVVFEWITDDLGSQGTVCGGGRYDGLIERNGGPPTPAVGFSLGVDRLVDLLQVQARETASEPPHVYLVAVGDGAATAATAAAERLRDELPRLRLELNLGGGSFKAQFKRADKSGATWAMVIGEEELKNASAQWKPLREAGAQQQIALDALPAFIAETIPELGDID